MHYKSWIATTALATTLFITGCGGNNTEDALDNGMTDIADNADNIAYNQEEFRNSNYKSAKDYNMNDAKSEQFGYVRYTRDQVDSEDEVRYALIDRKAVSDLITRMILQGKGFKDASTLVTDSEVLIAYTPDGSMDRNITADTAKKTAMSIVPRYYEVYVSDEQNMYRELANLSNLQTKDKGYRQELESTIKQMRKSPQGEPTYNDETKSTKDKRDTMENGTDMMGR